MGKKRVGRPPTKKTVVAVAKKVDKNPKPKKREMFIQDAIKKPGALRKSLKTKEGKDIPEKKIEVAAKKPGKLGKRARFALFLQKIRPKKKK